MADKDRCDQIIGVVDEINAVDENSILRPDIGGSFSLNKDFGPRLIDIKNKLKIVVNFCPMVTNEQADNVMSCIVSIRNLIVEQSARSDDSYFKNKSDFLQSIETYYQDMIDNYWTPFLSLYMESIGDTSNENIREYGTKIINDTRRELGLILEDVKSEANQIKSSAQDTAAGISVDEAQRQFREARIPIKKSIVLWSILSSVFLLGFLVYVFSFSPGKGAGEFTWDLIYGWAIKISIMIVVGTVVAFCVRMLRAYIYIREKNEHRLRVANCIGSFVGSASTQDQRDQILIILVESVVQFGASGLIPKEEDGPRSKVAVEAFLKSLSSNTVKD